MTKQIEVETLRDWLDAQRPVTVQVRRTGKACLSYIAGSARRSRGDRSVGAVRRLPRAGQSRRVRWKNMSRTASLR